MDEFKSFLVGVGITAIVLLFLLGGKIYNLEKPMKTAIEQCEKSLPRDQSCEVVITAKVKEIK